MQRFDRKPKSPLNQVVHVMVAILQDHGPMTRQQLRTRTRARFEVSSSNDVKKELGIEGRWQKFFQLAFDRATGWPFDLIERDRGEGRGSQCVLTPFGASRVVWSPPDA
jgi:hypothetical protein